MTAPGTSQGQAEHGLLVVVSGPSGVGKGTVVRGLLERFSDAVVSMSATTRHPRTGEVHGVDYLFVSPEQFDEMVEAGEFLEHATYAANQYGTPAVPIEEQIGAGRIVLLDIEVQGAKQVRASDPGALLLFLAPPDEEELERRLRSRDTEDEATVARRLAAARDELDQRFEFDHVVVNDDIERCIAEVGDLVARARARA